MILLIFGLIPLIFIICTIYIQSTFAKFSSNVTMKGKVVIVTGGNGGIGFYTAKNLAARGARVILACRNKERGSSARDSIIASTGNHNVVYKNLDLCSLASVRQFAADILATEPFLHVLVNNAGVYGCNDFTEDGIVETVQVNYLSPFLLTLLLLPLLKKSRPSRIVNITSILHFIGTFNPDTINDTNIKSQFLGSCYNYSDSKFCVLMFTVELARRLQGSGVVVNAVSPGVLRTGLQAHLNLFTDFLFRCWALMYNRTPVDGAQTVEYAAVAEECENLSGKHFVDCASRVMLWTVKNESLAKKLWIFSEDIVQFKERDLL